MSHYFSFSMGALHNENAKRLIGEMKDIAGLQRDDFNYSEEHEEVFRINLKKGILAIYSINSVLESVIGQLGVCYEIKMEKFYSVLNELKDRKVIEEDENLTKLLNMRNLRNMVTHWKKDVIKLQGTMHYLPYHFHDYEETVESSSEEQKLAELIEVLNQKDIQILYNSLQSFIKKVLESMSSEEVECRMVLDAILNHEILGEVG